MFGHKWRLSVDSALFFLNPQQAVVESADGTSIPFVLGPDNRTFWPADRTEDLSFIRADHGHFLDTFIRSVRWSSRLRSGDWMAFIQLLLNHFRAK